MENMARMMVINAIMMATIPGRSRSEGVASSNDPRLVEQLGGLQAAGDGGGGDGDEDIDGDGDNYEDNDDDDGDEV